MIQQNGPRVPHLPCASHVPQVWLLLNSFFKAFSNHRALKSKLLRWCFFLDTLCRKWYVFCFQNCSYPLWEKIFVIEWSIVSICHQLFTFIQICYGHTEWIQWAKQIPIGNSAFPYFSRIISTSEQLICDITKPFMFPNLWIPTSLL